MFPYRVNTQKPNPILKITIRFTKTPTMPKYVRNVGKCSKIESSEIFIMYKLYNSNFVFFGFFVICGFY